VTLIGQGRDPNMF